MGYYNKKFNDLNYKTKIIGKIPIEFNENLEEQIKKSYELFLVENESCGLEFVLAVNKNKLANFKVLEGIVKDAANCPDMEEAQEIE